MVAVLVLLAVLVFLVLIILPLALRVVPEYQRLAVFRLGRMIGLKGPGLVILIPVVDRPTKIDLREFYFEIPRQTSFTKDNAPISIDFIIFYKVVDPALSVLEVGNFAGAAQNIAATTLRSVVGDIPLDDVLAKRDEINQVLRAKLDEVTERWGVKVTSVEIREILPPPPVQEAMTRQMSAERTRRAVVTESEGNRQAAILQAEGEKQAAILSAEGNKEAAILNAEGDRQAAVLRAEGYATALTNINTAAATVDVKTMGLQYLDALKEIGSYPSTKFIFPMELTGLLGNVSAATTQAFGDAGGTAAPRTRHT
ncbi:MAG: SPFH/Band 7/PHB domain protein [Actinobacteria bacterium]|nr:SPFH/Band 7/PHB domain protein [Actinomycetota bacterium]